MNDLFIAGKIVGDFELKKSESGTEYGQMNVSIKKPFKNKDGVQESEIFQVTVFKSCLDEAKNIANDGTPLLIKGHLNSSSYPKDGKTYYSTSIIADRITAIEQMC